MRPGNIGSYLVSYKQSTFYIKLTIVYSGYIHNFIGVIALVLLSSKDEPVVCAPIHSL